MKKIKYGRNKIKSNNNIQQLKDGDNDICSAVLDTLSQDYLTYISDLVKVSKTPPKKKNQQKIDKLFKDNQYIDQNIKQSSKKLISLPIEKQIKNQTTRIKKKQHQMNIPDWKNINLINQQIKNKIQLQFFQQKNLDRKITQPQNHQKINSTSILLKNQDQLNTQYQQIKFLQNIDQYLLYLQSTKNNNKKKRQKSQQKIQQILLENSKLKKKINQYQQKIQDLQQSVTQHLNYCKKKDKTNKAKINDLVKGLAQAIAKINKQKQQIKIMTTLFKSFGKKVQQYREYQDNQNSSIQEQIHQSLSKAMRPTRTQSEYRVKAKKTLNQTMKRLDDDDDFIDW